MVYFTDDYNVISIEKPPSKTGMGKDSRYFNDSTLLKPDSSSITQNLLSLLKTQKKAITLLDVGIH